VEYQIGEYVYLKVTPFKGTQRFQEKGKLAPRYIGPFRIYAKRGEVAYALALPDSLWGEMDAQDEQHPKYQGTQPNKKGNKKINRNKTNYKKQLKINNKEISYKVQEDSHTIKTNNLQSLSKNAEHPSSAYYIW
jgi:hypothetical protein